MYYDVYTVFLLTYFTLEGNPLRTSVTAVQAESSPGVVQLFDDQSSVEAALQRCFSDRFRSTDGSPLMQSPLFDLLGNGTTTTTGQALLRGDTTSLPPTSLYTRWLLEGIAKPAQSPPTVNITISRSDFQRYWRRAKEKTASSISGLHFGHYKAAASTDLLSEIQSLLTEIVFRTGYPLKRWQSGLQIILEKKPGVILVTKLRAILLIEADFNFGNKLLVGSRMTNGALLNKCIPQELYGGVKGRRVEYMSLGRRLFADILRQKRCRGAIASVDAQACYDRITHSMALLCCQRWGMPPRPLSTMLHTIQGMRFHLRTGYGDSAHFYGGDNSGFQGICQGNGAGPAVWLAISSVLVYILKAKTPCNPIRGALSATGLFLLAMLFVDDTELFLVDLPHRSTGSSSPLLLKLQALIHLWQGLLQASGGSLSADKCSWCLVDFKWQAGKWSYHTSITSPGDMFVKDNNGHKIKIQRINPNQSLTVVGVEQSMDGSMAGQLRVLDALVNRWTRALASQRIPRHIAWAAIRSKIWPTLRFPLSSTTISQQQGRKLMGPLYRSLLPRLGSNRNIPACVRYGPLDIAGLDLPEPYYIYQGSQQIALFQQLYNTQTNEGHLLKASLEHLQLEVGQGSPVLLLDFNRYGFLATPSWLTSLWQFLSSYSIRLDIPDFPLPTICRLGDGFIMEDIMLCPSLSREEQLSANKCRLHLQTVVWSDITNGGGTSVRDSSFRVQRDPSVLSKYEWPAERPSKHDVSNWQTCLGTVLGPRPLSLGSWIADPHYTCTWSYDHPEDLIFKDHLGHWLEYGPSVTRTTRFTAATGWSKYKLQHVHSWDTRPIHLTRCTVQEFDDGRIALEGIPPANIAPVSNHTPIFPHDTIYQEVATWPMQFRGFLDVSVLPHQGTHIAQTILNGTAHGACDGSYMPHRSLCIGTCAWVLEDETLPGQHICHGTASTTGWIATDVNAYRSELQGIYTVLLALRAVGNLHQVTSGSVRIACDNATAVSLVNHTVNNGQSLSSAHVDLLRSICWLQQSLKFTVTFVHVYGHQDRLTPQEYLPRLAQLNIRCDTMAKEAALREIAQHRLRLHHAPLWGEQVALFLPGNIKLTGHIQSRVAHWCALNDTQRYLIHKNILPEHLAAEVNWTGLGHYLRSQSTPFRLWATKHSYNFEATGHNMVRWGLSRVAECPCCGASTETSIHLYECADARMLATRLEAIQAFHDWMTSAATHPDIISCFCSSLTLHSPMAAHASTAISTAADTRDTLGKWNTLVGRLSRVWETIQEDYYHSTGCSKSISAWSAGMVECLLAIGHKCWTTRNNILHDQTLGGLSLSMSPAN